MVNKKIKYIIGIDEVGRGCLAGPVTVVALAMEENLKILSLRDISRRETKSTKLRDSKKLSPKQREEWFKYIKSRQDIFYAIKNVSPRIIDKINISQAANLAASRALVEVCKLINHKLAISIFLDGGLYVNRLKTNDLRLTTKNLKLKTIIRGDEKIPAISLASIMAKVHRDRKMKNLHKKYPKYGFHEHKGYGTKKHVKAIKKRGLSPIHRRSFKLK